MPAVDSPGESTLKTGQEASSLSSGEFWRSLFRVRTENFLLDSVKKCAHVNLELNRELGRKSAKGDQGQEIALI